MSKKILVIDAHPDPQSYCACIAEEYYLSAKSRKFQTEILKIRELKFDPILHFGYKRKQRLEKDLKKAQKLITWCDHLVVVTPVWWFSPPALFKSFIERTFLPGFAFEYSKTHKRQLLLNGRTVRLFYTQGVPWWVTKFLYCDVFWRQIKKGIFKFCGLGPIKRTYIGHFFGLKNLPKRQKFLWKVKELGKKGK